MFFCEQLGQPLRPAVNGKAFEDRAGVLSNDGWPLVGDGGRVPASHWQSQWHTDIATLNTIASATGRFT